MSVLRRLAAFWQDHTDLLRDLHCYGGVALIGVGAYAMYEPAGYVSVGVTLLYLALRRPPDGNSTSA